MSGRKRVLRALKECCPQAQRMSVAVIETRK
jgi:hypothetical protein